jgi:hypothetical protein
MYVSDCSRRHFVLSLGAAAAGRVSAKTDEHPVLNVDEVETFLREGLVTKSRSIGVGITGTVRATLSHEGLTYEAHIQTIDESRSHYQTAMGTELNFRDSWMFNIAGYRLDVLLGLNMTPPSVERKWKGQEAAFTWWVPNTMMERDRMKKKIKPPDVDVFNQQMYAVRVFDQLIFNTDRNLQNLLIGPDWNLWMIDHTRAFRIRKDLNAQKDLAKCDRALLAKLRHLDQATLKERMGEYLRPLEIEGLLTRRDRIVELFEKKIAQSGEAQVLYDMARRPRAYRIPPQAGKPT